MLRCIHAFIMYDQPSASLELEIQILRAEVIETKLYGCVTWSPRACHYGTLRRAHGSFLTRCIGWRKTIAPTTCLPKFLDTLKKAGSDFTQEVGLVRGICGAHGGYETAEVRDGRRTGGGRELRGGRKKSGWGVFWTTSELLASTPTSEGLQPRTRKNGAGRRNKRRNISWRNDRCGESQGWTMVCSGMSERDGKDQGEDSPKQAGLCWFARHSRLATSGTNLYPPGVWFADAMSYFSGVNFFSICFVVVFLLSLKLRPLV